MLLVPKVQNKASTSYIFFKNLYVNSFFFSFFLRIFLCTFSFINGIFKLKTSPEASNFYDAISLFTSCYNVCSKWQIFSLEIHEKSTKNKRFQCVITQVILAKILEIKSKYKCELYYTFGIINIDNNRSCKKLFLPSFNQKI